MKTLFYVLVNFWLRIRYNYFKPKKRKTFNGEIIFSYNNFNNLSEFKIKDKEFYANCVWFTKNMVRVENNILKLDCVYNPQTHTNWQGSMKVNWDSASIETEPLINYGTWSVLAKTPKTFPAIWLLRELHMNKDKISTITPEVDIMEVINGKFQHTIHYNPTETNYSTRKFGKNNHVRYDNKLHEFTVDLTPKGYKFYIDGILTCLLLGDERNSTTDVRSYLLLNNAEHFGSKNKKTTTFEIHKITIRKNKYTTTNLNNSEPWIK